MTWGLHRTGECGEALCLAAFNEEMGLELPFRLNQRLTYYERQRQVYLPWTNNIAVHRWHFRQNGVCHNCEGNGLTVVAGGMQLCIAWCLTTVLPWYPTGWVQPLLPDLMNHAKNCTSHSSSPTSQLIASLDKLSSSYSPLQAELRSNSIFYLGPLENEVRSHSGTLSLNLDSLLLNQPNFDIPKR